MFEFLRQETELFCLAAALILKVSHPGLTRKSKGRVRHKNSPKLATNHRMTVTFVGSFHTMEPQKGPNKSSCPGMVHTGQQPPVSQPSENPTLASKLGKHSALKHTDPILEIHITGNDCLRIGRCKSNQGFDMGHLGMECGFSLLFQTSMSDLQKGLIY